MAVTSAKVELTEEKLAGIQSLLRELDLDSWLIYDFRGMNPIAASILGIPTLTRRLFVLIPSIGRPTAITHRIEQQPWEGWIGENRPYLSWQSLRDELGRLLSGRERVALEYSAGDAVPYADRVPAGVVELIQAAARSICSSADLVTALHSRWGAEGLASHHRAAAILQDAAFSAFDWIGASIAGGFNPSEWDVRGAVLNHLHRAGLPVGSDAVVAVNANAANPHYSPAPNGSTPIGFGDLVLLDLWGKTDPAAVYADQTWMAVTGQALPDQHQAIWTVVRDARDAAVDFIGSRFRSRQPIAGWEVDEAARSLIVRRGFGDAFIHRTGHSIDRELHGSGPNLDNLETRDQRLLIDGVGFSVEPGIYLEGLVGMRSEINVFIGADGPEVTTPNVQREIHRIAVGPR